MLESYRLVDQKAAASTVISSKRPPGGKKIHNALMIEHDGIAGCMSDLSGLGPNLVNRIQTNFRSDSGEADIAFYSKN